MLTAKELQQLLPLAQAYDQAAIDAICKAFEPLIYKEALRPYVRDTFGEDAINMAWEIFLEFIYKYNGHNFRHLPGLLQCHLRYELLHKIQRQTSITDYDSLNAAAEDNNSALLADTTDPISSFELRFLLERALRKLTQQQRKVFVATQLRGLSLKEYSQGQGVSFKTVYLHKQRALTNLQKMLA